MDKVPSVAEEGRLVAFTSFGAGYRKHTRTPAGSIVVASMARMSMSHCAGARVEQGAVSRGRRGHRSATVCRSPVCPPVP